MTYKSTSFKRIALAVVAALGFGVLATGPSSAVISTATDGPTLALSATSASAAPGETASVTLTVNFTSTAAFESVNVVTNDLGSTNITERFKGLTTDSQNVRTSSQTSNWANITTVWPSYETMSAYRAIDTANTFSVFSSTRPDSVVTATGTGVYINSNENSTTPTPVQAKLTLEFIVGTSATAGFIAMQ